MNIERSNRNTWIGLGIVVLVALGAMSAVGGGMMGHPLFGYGARPFVGQGPWLWGFGLIGLVIRLAVWGVLIMLAVRLFRRVSARNDFTHQATSSLEILKQRYAAGEITREQFEEMRRVLDSSPQ